MSAAHTDTRASAGWVASVAAFNYDAPAQRVAATPEVQGPTTTSLVNPRIAAAIQGPSWRTSPGVAHPVSGYRLAARDETELFKAAGANETRDIECTVPHAYRPSPQGSEGKYFFVTREEAERYAAAANANLSDASYRSITSGRFPTSLVEQLDKFR